MVGGTKVPVQADFASDHVTFSRGRRGEVKYTDIQVLSTARGILKLRVDGASMEFTLGDKVDRVANKIRQPPSLLDKLGVKAGQQVANDLDLSGFARQLAAAGTVEIKGNKPAELLFVPAGALEDLAMFPQWSRRIHADGAIWIIYRKGRREFGENDIITAGRHAGLVDVKVARFSETHSALKFMVPRDDRPEP